MNVARIGCEQDLEQLQFAEPAFNEAALLRDLVEADVVAPDAIKEVLAYRKKYGTDLLDTIELLGIGSTFAVALRHILRHDPDDILTGEMRDFEAYLINSSVVGIMA